MSIKLVEEVVYKNTLPGKEKEIDGRYVVGKYIIDEVSVIGEHKKMLPWGPFDTEEDAQAYADSVGMTISE